MNQARLLMAVVACLASLLCGCSVSSLPPVPLQVAAAARLASGITSTPYAANLSANGGVPPYTWSVGSGNLPPGLALSSGGTVSGTPTSAGAFTFTVQVTDLAQPKEVTNILVSITIADPLLVTTASLPGTRPGVFYSGAISAIGGVTPYSWTLMQGSLPGGLTLDASSGIISGTPNESGTANFTVGVSDSATPPESATAALSIVIAPQPPPPPLRGAAIYVEEVNDLGQGTDVLGLGIAKDGSLSPLPSSPEPAPFGYMAVSSKAPSVFVLQQPDNKGSQELDALLVNPDYSLSSYTSTKLINVGDPPPAVDPTGQNLYLVRLTDSQHLPDLVVLTADGAFNTVQTIPTGVTPILPMLFTPDGKHSFQATNEGRTITSFARADDGTLTLLGTVDPGFPMVAAGVSPDGKYLATAESIYSGELALFIQIYSISPSGTLTAVLSPPFQVTLGNGALVVPVNDLVWDASSTYLLAATGEHRDDGTLVGGLAVLSFSGSAITELVEPSEGPMQYVVRTNSFIYAMKGYYYNSLFYGPIVGYSFENGQLTPLPGSPYSAAGKMVIY